MVLAPVVSGRDVIDCESSCRSATKAPSSIPGDDFFLGLVTRLLVGRWFRGRKDNCMVFFVLAMPSCVKDPIHAGVVVRLEEIESVSTHLAELIRTISDSAKQQASAAINISDTMNVIQEITTQTSAGTNETAASIGNLAELANELRNSVAGFRL